MNTAAIALDGLHKSYGASPAVRGLSLSVPAGSVCGLIGAILYYGKSRGGFYGEQIFRQAMGWVAGLVIFGLFFPGINNWAHGGGLLAGIGIAFATGYRERNEERFSHRFLAMATILVTGAVLLWAIIQAVYLLIV